jgi:two-component system, OmpR family, sensor histidine kinase KdpD
MMDREHLWTGLISLRWMGRYGDMAAVRYMASTVLVAGGAGLATFLAHVVDVPDFAIAFLPAVLLSAILWGRGPALLAAALSVVTLSYFFYEPAFSFQITGLTDVVDLILFVGVAILCSDLAAHIKRQGEEATQREFLMARLYDFSRRVAGIADPAELFRAIAEHLSDVLGSGVVLLAPAGARLAAVGTASGADFGEPDLLAAEGLWADDRGPLDSTLPSGWHLRMLRTGRAKVAVLAIYDRGQPAQVPKAHIESLLDQAAVAIERTQLARAYEDARVAAKTESLREALINSISHDLQTPLASIVGSATALQSFEALYGHEARGDLIATIREEAERLHHIINNILDLTRIRAGEINPRLELVELSDIINAALARTRKTLADHQLAVSIPPDLPMLQLDLFLLEHALVNLLENAGKYAPKGTPISLTARRVDSDVAIEVTDAGVGIAAPDIGRIFDRFVRATGTDTRPAGSGLGLTICRAFVEANGGRVEAYSAGPGKGATFRVLLPIPEASLTLDSSVRDE